MKQITEDMLTQFNETILKDYAVELSMIRNMTGSVKVALKSNPFVDTAIINMSDLFYNLLINYFKYVYGIKLKFNCTGTEFWSEE